MIKEAKRNEKIIFPEEVKEKVIELYEFGHGPCRIAKIIRKLFNFDVSYSTIKNRLIEWNITKNSAIFEV